MSTDGLILALAHLGAQGDLASGGGLTVVVRGTSPLIASCRWTLDGIDQCAC